VRGERGEGRRERGAGRGERGEGRGEGGEERGQRKGTHLVNQRNNFIIS
jgi:hypothetical protein